VTAREKRRIAVKVREYRLKTASFFFSLILPRLNLEAADRPPKRKETPFRVAQASSARTVIIIIII